IDEGAGLARLVVGHDDQAQRHPDLRGGQADPGLVVHGVHHVGDEIPDVRGDLPHGVGPTPERRIAVSAHFQDGHSTGSTSTSMIPRLRAAPTVSAPSSALERTRGRSAWPFTTTRRARFRRSGAAGYTVSRGVPASAAVTASASRPLSAALGAATVMMASRRNGGYPSSARNLSSGL